jgi:hypothetical protein
LYPVLVEGVLDVGVKGGQGGDARFGLNEVGIELIAGDPERFISDLANFTQNIETFNMMKSIDGLYVLSLPIDFILGAFN